MLIGISLGPGDPKLMTFKAAEALQSCVKVFVPGEMAAELARPYCNPEILEFPMIEDREELERIGTTTEMVATFATAASELCHNRRCEHLLNIQPS
jgi:precorrin-2/cobalt-factor-2 C20-methyltransferase